MYKVSIIIPIYNVQLYIKDALLSALDQSFESIEYILIDDCGTDDSMKIVHSIIENHPRKKDVFICKHETNMGLSVARNTGIEKSTSDFFYFMDSDDEISNSCIDLHYKEALLFNADFTVGNLELQGKKISNLSNCRFKSYVGDEIFSSFLRKEWSETACNKLYSRRFVKDCHLSFRSGLIHEDILWGYQLAKNASRIVAVTRQTYFYKIRTDSITTSISCFLPKINSLLDIMELISSDYNSLSSEVKTLFLDYVYFLKFKCSLLLIISPMSKAEKYIIYNKIRKQVAEKESVVSKFRYPLMLNYWTFVLVFKVPYLVYRGV